MIKYLKIEGLNGDDNPLEFNFNDDSFRNVLNAIRNFVDLNYENITGISGLFGSIIAGFIAGYSQRFTNRFFSKMS